MSHMSNRERIARAAEEARLAAAEKTAKKATKKTSGGGSTRAPKNVRLKVIWEVCDGTGKVVKSFPYAEKAGAESEVTARTQSTGRTHVLRPTKVPME